MSGLKNKKYTTAQRLTRLETVTTKLFVNIKALEQEVGEMQKAMEENGMDYVSKATRELKIAQDKAREEQDQENLNENQDETK